MKMSVLILTFVLTSSAFANSKNDPDIPFIFKKTVVVNSKGKAISEYKGEYAPVIGKHYIQLANSETAAVHTTLEKESMKASNVTKIVKDIRDSLCNAIQDGEFKVWLKFDASGKILGIGASSEGGIEATIKCTKS